MFWLFIKYRFRSLYSTLFFGYFKLKYRRLLRVLSLVLFFVIPEIFNSIIYGDDYYTFGYEYFLGEDQVIFLAPLYFVIIFIISYTVKPFIAEEKNNKMKTRVLGKTLLDELQKKGPNHDRVGESFITNSKTPKT